MAISCNEMSGQVLCMCNPPTWTNNGYPQVYDSIYLAAEACGGASVKPPISDNLPNKKDKRKTKTKTKYLNMNHSQNSNCNAFNNRRMFDEFNGFTGYSQGTFDHTSDRDIDWLSARGTSGGACPPNTIPCATGCCPASSPQPARETGGRSRGRGAVRPTGGTAPARDTGCPPKACGSVYGAGCPAARGGCGCSDRKRGSCGAGGGVLRYSNNDIANEIRRSGGQVPRNFFNQYPSTQREVAGGSKCGGKCGSHWGISCDHLKGCRCSSTLNGVCEDATKLAPNTPTTIRNFAGGSFHNGGMRLR